MHEEKTPKVSVCVVTYNQEKYIRQCLQSIVDQETDFDFEVIVGDDCSTDGTRAIVQEFADKYQGQVNPIFHEKNIGPCQNYLSVHKSAKGEYVAHVDGDDWCFLNKLARQADYLDVNNDCVAVVHKLLKYNASGESLSNFWPIKFNYKQYDLIDLVKSHCAFGHSSLMFRKDALSSFIKTAPPEFIDFIVYVHLAAQGKIGALNEALGAYTYGVGVSTKQNLYEFAIQAMNYAKKLGLSEDVFSYAVARQYLHFAKQAFVENNYVLFEKLISKSIKQQLISPVQLALYILRKNINVIKITYRISKTVKH